ncbi:hypothetical protein TNCV_1359381 [Trichonephila clavipes]|nr:hypothetical protein TNCV_1359381 [Trichonephila clavipes]
MSYYTSFPDLSPTKPFDDWIKTNLEYKAFATLSNLCQFEEAAEVLRGVTQEKNETGPINHRTYRISSLGQYNLESSSVQHSHTSAFGGAITSNTSGTRFLEILLEYFPFLPETFQLR